MDNYKYTCSVCGEEHNEWPALGFISPDHYSYLSDEDKENIAVIDEDCCVIKHATQVDRFIRGVLVQKVQDSCQDLDYGLWVSLSEKSFEDYLEHYDDEDYETSYFGWLCNKIPGYTFEKSIPATVYTQKGNQRPVIVPHKDFDHPFVHDYYNGITVEEAESRVAAMLRNLENG